MCIQYIVHSLTNRHQWCSVHFTIHDKIGHPVEVDCSDEPSLSANISKLFNWSWHIVDINIIAGFLATSWREDFQPSYGHHTLERTKISLDVTNISTVLSDEPQRERWRNRGRETGLHLCRCRLVAGPSFCFLSGSCSPDAGDAGDAAEAVVKLMKLVTGRVCEVVCMNVCACQWGNRKNTKRKILSNMIVYSMWLCEIFQIFPCAPKICFFFSSSAICMQSLLVNSIVN